MLVAEAWGTTDTLGAQMYRRRAAIVAFCLMSVLPISTTAMPVSASAYSAGAQIVTVNGHNIVVSADAVYESTAGYTQFACTGVSPSAMEMAITCYQASGTSFYATSPGPAVTGTESSSLSTAAVCWRAWADYPNGDSVYFPDSCVQPNAVPALNTDALVNSVFAVGQGLPAPTQVAIDPETGEVVLLGETYGIPDSGAIISDPLTVMGGYQPPADRWNLKATYYNLNNGRYIRLRYGYHNYDNRKGFGYRHLIGRDRWTKTYYREGLEEAMRYGWRYPESTDGTRVWYYFCKDNIQYQVLVDERMLSDGLQFGVLTGWGNRISG